MKWKNPKFFLMSLCFILLISLVFYLGKRGSTSSVKNSVNIGAFNANGNDQEDDTANIQHAIDAISDGGGGVVFVPKGTYYINALKSIKLKDNVTLDFDNGVTLKALPNDSTNYEIIKIEDVKNVTLNGNVHIVGERNEHKGNSSEWGMGISILGSQNVSINDVRVSDCWGDGIYIGKNNGQTNRNITISNPVLDNNRRQGISVITAIDLQILNPSIRNTSGTRPASGIDLEPNSNTERLQKISIINPSTENNDGRGISFDLTRLEGTKYPVDITINNPSKIKDGYKLVNTGNVKGTIKIGNKIIYKK